MSLCVIDTLVKKSKVINILAVTRVKQQNK